MNKAIYRAESIDLQRDAYARKDYVRNGTRDLLTGTS